MQRMRISAKLTTKMLQMLWILGNNFQAVSGGLYPGLFYMVGNMLWQLRRIAVVYAHLTSKLAGYYKYKNERRAGSTFC